LKDTYQTLQNLAGTKGNPFDGVALEYTNPRDGGHTLPTIGCWIQMLRPGEKTKTHRHNSSTIYHAFKGEGSTVINGERFDWSEGIVSSCPYGAGIAIRITVAKNQFCSR
jgi:1-hydroxy-2-naphthoate dioxygenase